jgi:hypothetical protein
VEFVPLEPSIILKNGLARVSDWSARMMNPLDIPAFRVAENNAKVSM